MTLTERRILLIVSGGIAAYKSLDLVRRLRERGASVRPILTAGGAQFVTPLALSSLAEHKVYTDLFSLTDESEMGHIRLSREADLVVVAPASADLMAKMANGLADDLASTALLATDKPVLIAPAMNPMMWQHPATIRNRERLQADGVTFVGPGTGDMACGEVGAGRMAEPLDIVAAIEALFSRATARLHGLRALVTSGPTFEALDPVRFLGNRSSGKQGHAIAQALADHGMQVVLVSGPVALPDPTGVEVVRVESAMEMLAACQQALPVDVAVCAAAVADWRPERRETRKIKKGRDESVPTLHLEENPDILATLSRPGPLRPRLVVGFAAETEDLVDNARAKLARKGCDWLVANAVDDQATVFGSERNEVRVLRADDGGVAEDAWPAMSKAEVAKRLAAEIVETAASAPQPTDGVPA
ncbi:bifunctional phosphopantothenoylcysteine decarboxylase/phosphopantothenate--cysteine ligase CoaBC [Marinivivus vitaminiproducens]|uniref:bifunctional phosphopantothenoylcysteine decarboxylase/phosphopantothenate--cysteine ligase CoaBC n=1 Tax=Marinivivus vitaminiproducens TaxID=3035935 RepID=UPI00279B9EA6|nr:bifunctional phosphopantothenoylcysteine decarboxylase/phosphopantothenate--cysteine ligase CoaBC [Geminicoccaceae bacterium SCSIO 64248]